jgi:ArsR family transcriptional regulator, arsenate/arsenite/antimonite-responsive transcriptional repressor
MSDNINIYEILDFFKIMVDADRLRIAGLLGVESLSPVQLAQRLRLQPSAVVTHLDRLAGAGLVREVNGSYSLERKALEGLARRNLAGLRPAPKVEEFDGEAFDKKVVLDFMGPDGRFKTLPNQDKKFQSILRYTVRVFEPGKEYTEKEVNGMLMQFHADTASLRRGLVDSGFLERSQGVNRQSIYRRHLVKPE